ncbi:hypothetical protein GR04_24690 [Escherichia coli]|nr:hypothetical protein GR04_24690 [Escherichia coli]
MKKSHTPGIAIIPMKLMMFIQRASKVARLVLIATEQEGPQLNLLMKKDIEMKKDDSRIFSKIKNRKSQ